MCCSGYAFWSSCCWSSWESQFPCDVVTDTVIELFSFHILSMFSHKTPKLKISGNTSSYIKWAGLRLKWDGHYILNWYVIFGRWTNKFVWRLRVLILQWSRICIRFLVLETSVWFGGFGWSDLGEFECLISVSCLGFITGSGLLVFMCFFVHWRSGWRKGVGFIWVWVPVCPPFEDHAPIRSLSVHFFSGDEAEKDEERGLSFSILLS